MGWISALTLVFPLLKWWFWSVWNSSSCYLLGATLDPPFFRPTLQILMSWDNMKMLLLQQLVFTTSTDRFPKHSESQTMNTWMFEIKLCYYPRMLDGSTKVYFCMQRFKLILLVSWFELNLDFLLPDTEERRRPAFRKVAFVPTLLGCNLQKQIAFWLLWKLPWVNKKNL